MSGPGQRCGLPGLPSGVPAYLCSLPDSARLPAAGIVAAAAFWLSVADKRNSAGRGWLVRPPPTRAPQDQLVELALRMGVA